MSRSTRSIVLLFLVVTGTFQQLAGAERSNVTTGLIVDEQDILVGFQGNETLSGADNASSAVEDVSIEEPFPAAAAPNATLSDNTIIPGQYIVFYKDKSDRPSFSTAQQQRLPFRIIRELRKAIAVADLDDQQYQQLLEDPAVEKVVPVSCTLYFICRGGMHDGPAHIRIVLSHILSLSFSFTHSHTLTRTIRLRWMPTEVCLKRAKSRVLA